MCAHVCVNLPLSAKKVTSREMLELEGLPTIPHIEWKRGEEQQVTPHPKMAKRQEEGSRQRTNFCLLPRLLLQPSSPSFRPPLLGPPSCLELGFLVFL